jgi:hypothetical protein
MARLSYADTAQTAVLIERRGIPHQPPALWLWFS